MRERKPVAAWTGSVVLKEGTSGRDEGGIEAVEVLKRGALREDMMPTT